MSIDNINAVFISASNKVRGVCWGVGLGGGLRAHAGS